MESIEAIKLILELGPNAGQAAMSVAIWYLVVTNLVPAVTILLISSMVLYVVVRHLMPLLATKFTLARWRDELGIGLSGPLTPQEKAETVKKIDTLVRTYVQTRPPRQARPR